MDVIGQRQINSTGLPRCFSYPHHFPPRRVCVLKLSNIRLKKMCSFTLHLTAAAFFLFFALKVQTGFFFFYREASMLQTVLTFIAAISFSTGSHFFHHQLKSPNPELIRVCGLQKKHSGAIRSPPYKCASSLRQLSLATKNANGALS